MLLLCPEHPTIPTYLLTSASSQDPVIPVEGASEPRNVPQSVYLLLRRFTAILSPTILEGAL